MAAIVSRSLHTGLELLNAQGYLTCFLHLYNLLQQVGVTCPKILILEHLCDLLGSAVFRGMRNRYERHRIYVNSHSRGCAGSSSSTYVTSEPWLVSNWRADASSVKAVRQLRYPLSSRAGRIGIT
jgi:hypothetical protein